VPGGGCLAFRAHVRGGGRRHGQQLAESLLLPGRPLAQHDVPEERHVLAQVLFPAGRGEVAALVGDGIRIADLLS
jgi:hypothetical protein